MLWNEISLLCLQTVTFGVLGHQVGMISSFGKAILQTLEKIHEENKKTLEEKLLEKAVGQEERYSAVHSNFAMVASHVSAEAIDVFVEQLNIDGRDGQITSEEQVISRIDDLIALITLDTSEHFQNRPEALEVLGEDMMRLICRNIVRSTLGTPPTNFARAIMERIRQLKNGESLGLDVDDEDTQNNQNGEDEQPI